MLSAVLFGSCEVVFFAEGVKSMQGKAVKKRFAVITALMMVINMNPITASAEEADGPIETEPADVADLQETPASDETGSSEEAEAGSQNETAEQEAEDSGEPAESEGEKENTQETEADDETAEESADAPSVTPAEDITEETITESSPEPVEEPVFSVEFNDPVPYIDGDGNDLDPVESYQWMENAEYRFLNLMYDSFYVVKGTVTIKGEITVSGSPTIILLDDSELKCAGLIVPDGSSVNIYCQKGKSGRLTSVNNNNGAGIGGREDRGAGIINIYGGIINATGDKYSAGIGGGDEGSKGTVNIYGGTVTAAGGDYAAGIGSGDKAADDFIVNIYGGKVHASAGTEAAGIGGGNKVSGGTINIFGGEVTAEGSKYGAGIGGGDEGSAGNITIEGGTVTAAGGSNGAGIGDGFEGMGGNITIKGGTVTATGGERAAGIGSGGGPSDVKKNMAPDTTIEGGTVTATGGDSGAGIGGGYYTRSGTITIDGDDADVTANGGIQAAGIGGGYGASADTLRIKAGTVNATGGGDEGTNISGGAGIGGGYKGSGGVIEIFGGNITAKGGKGSYTVPVGTDGGSGAGIGGGDNGNSGIIKIYGGTINATGGSSDHYGDGGAGIGGGDDGSGDLIEIYDGTITAKGGTGGGLTDGLTGSGGAGIGGGDDGKSGTINIYGGVIEADGGKSFSGGGAGIGGGDGESAETITITGGYIEAYGAGPYSPKMPRKAGGAGIGGGDGGKGGTIRIDLTNQGDAVFAYSSGDGAAVGRGGGSEDGILVFGDVTEVFKIEENFSELFDDRIFTPVSKTKRESTCRGKMVKLCVCQHENILQYIDLHNEENPGHQRICRNCYVERLDEKDPQPHVPDETGICTLCGTAEHTDVPYLDENGEKQICSEYELFSAADAEKDGLESGWYVVKQPNNEIGRRFAVRGDVHLIICEGCDLEANFGIDVPEDSSLTIYGQGGKAYLEAQGSEGDAGIGGSGGDPCGSISINDIIVEVSGGEGGAGIGGGRGGQYKKIVLNRCVTKASGGKGGAGIGGGTCEKEHTENNGTISISYGSLFADGGLGAAGIGGGKYQSGGTITIDGVKNGKRSDLNKLDSDVEKIVVYGGKNDANSGGAAAIGGGEFGDGGKITINGALIRAAGGDNTTMFLTTSGGGGAGIGGGADGSGGEITVNGGLIYSKGAMTAVMGVHDGGGAGIGGGDNGAAGTITINGGELYCYGGTASEDSKGGGAGIGGGDSGGGGRITINGGRTQALGTGHDTRSFGKGNGGETGILYIADQMCAYKGTLNSSNIADSLFPAEKRVSKCLDTVYTFISVIPCEHLNAEYVIGEPAHTGHSVSCRNCLTDPEETQKHTLDENAECVCGYHGVILSFDPGYGSEGAGTMKPAVLLGGTEYTLPECGFIQPDHQAFSGWNIEGNTYDEKTEYKTPETKEETAELKAVAQWIQSDHVWNEPVYTWSEDNSTVTAERTCRLDESHKETETVKTDISVTREPTETEKGELVYTAVFKNEAFQKQTRTEMFDAAGGGDDENDEDPAKKKFTISYDLNGGTLDGKTGVITIRTEEGSTITIPEAPVREGYRFTYWKGSEYYPGDSYKVESDHTFTAQWKKDEASGGGKKYDSPMKDSDTSKSKTSPETADGINTGLWFMLLTASLLLAVFTVSVRRISRD